MNEKRPTFEELMNELFAPDREAKRQRNLQRFKDSAGRQGPAAEAKAERVIDRYEML